MHLGYKVDKYIFTRDAVYEWTELLYRVSDEWYESPLARCSEKIHESKLTQ